MLLSDLVDVLGIIRDDSGFDAADPAESVDDLVSNIHHNHYGKPDDCDCDCQYIA